MFSPRKILGICIIAIAVTAANADVIIDGQSIPSDHVSGVISVNPTNGNVIITTTAPGYTVTRNVVGDDVVITSFNVSPASVQVGSNVTVSWSVVNATSCAASGGTGSWGGAVAFSDGSHNQSVTASVLGDYTFTLTCQGTGGPVSAIADLAVTSTPAVVINQFFASPSAIEEGDTTTINWNVSGATSCTATGGTGTWGGAVAFSDGSHSQTITASVQGNYTFGLTCQNGVGGQDSASTIVSVTPVVTGCDPAPLSGNTWNWSSFWGEPFPGPASLLREVQIPKQGWIAIKFNTGNVIGTGGIQSIESTKTSGARLGAISECPGDFDVTLRCQHYWGIGGGIGWTTEGYPGACSLQPNTDYYLNVTFTNGVDPDSSTCDAIPCITKLRYYEN